MIKQHITVKQLREIPSEKLVPLIKDNLINVGDSELIRTNKTTNQLTIGKMIEILNNEFGWFEIAKESNEADGTVFWISIDPTREYYDFELCDALWCAVKEVLC